MVVEGEYEYTNDVPDDAFDAFDDLLTDENKIIISIVLIVALTIFTAMAGVNFIIIIILDVALLLFFVLAEWLPSWVGILMGGIVFIIFIKTILAKGAD